MYAAIDVALLVSEWVDPTWHVKGASSCCSVCGGLGDRRHAAPCAMDQALAERGFPTQVERDAARARIFASIETMPPPVPA